MRLEVIARMRLEVRQAQSLIDQVPQDDRTANILVTAPFLGSRTREVLRTSEVSYLDATGNLELRVDDPLIVIRLEGAPKNPWPDQRQLSSLKGPASARVLRALVDFTPPYRQTRLSELAQASAPTVSRVVRILDAEACLEKGEGGSIESVDWRRVLERWSSEYDVLATHRYRSFLEPRGFEKLLAKLADSGLRHAVTGSLATTRWGSFVPPGTALVYVEAPSEAARQLQLVEVDRGTNVILIEPYDDVVYQRASTEDGVTRCVASQVAVDMLTGPGREPSGGELLLDWMERNESVWRTQY